MGFGGGVASEEGEREGVTSSCMALTGFGFGGDILGEEVVRGIVAPFCRALLGFGLKVTRSPPLEAAAGARSVVIV